MEYEDLTYEECFNKIFNEININKKSINKLNDIVINQKKEIEELKNEIEDLKKTNEKERKNLEEYQNANEEDIDSHNNEIINLKQIIQNIQENEIEYIYENTSNLNIEVKENIKINSNTNNEIIELKEIKNNLHFSYVISSYKYHINYFKDTDKLEIDLFTKLINNNILPINFITPQGNNNDIGQYFNVVSHFMNKDDNKDKLKKYFNVNDVMNNKYSFDLAIIFVLMAQNLKICRIDLSIIIMKKILIINIQFTFYMVEVILVAMQKLK